MDPSERPLKAKLNRVETLSAHAEDAPYALRRHPFKPSRLYRHILVALVFIAAAGYLVVHFSELLNSAARQVTAPRNPEPELPVSANPVPPIYTRDALVNSPKPLSECIKPDNIIDEAVATCRYGQFPRAAEDPNPRGMVSDSYMAKYKAEQQQPARSKRIIAYNVERATVWQWDGKRTYVAEWTINNNRIDGTSVCTNYRRGSIEYRECRKGAKVYFREKCREWAQLRSKKNGGNPSSNSGAVEQRFCSAGDGFNPLG